MQKQAEAIASSDRQALLAAETSRANAATDAQASMTSNYLNAVSNLSANAKLKASDRNAYIAEFQRVTGQSAVYQQAASRAAMTLRW